LKHEDQAQHHNRCVWVEVEEEFPLNGCGTESAGNRGKLGQGNWDCPIELRVEHDEAHLGDVKQEDEW
jgi:hypothetical protein